MMVQIVPAAGYAGRSVSYDVVDNEGGSVAASQSFYLAVAPITLTEAAYYPRMRTTSSSRVRVVSRSRCLSILRPLTFSWARTTDS